MPHADDYTDARVPVLTRSPDHARDDENVVASSSSPRAPKNAGHGHATSLSPPLTLEALLSPLHATSTLTKNGPVASTTSPVPRDLDTAPVVHFPPPPFANMYACEACRDDIGSLLSQGRHHCRNCGGSFCASCSSQACIVPYDAYVTRGALRVCDACYHRIQIFQSQVKSTHVTWSGVPPPPPSDVMRAFSLPADERPIAIFHCALFLDTLPYYGHLVLTRQRVGFQRYVDAQTRVLAYASIVSVIKPPFYYITGLQVQTRERETLFFAEFHGLRDMCFLRLDQLLRAYQQAESKRARTGTAPSTHELRQQALDRRRSSKRWLEQLVAGRTTSSTRWAASTPVGARDGREVTSDTPSALENDVESPTDDGKSSSASDDDPFEPLAPDPLLENMTILLDCDLRADVQRVFELLWQDGHGQAFAYETMTKARDVDIEIEAWHAIEPHARASPDSGFTVSTEHDYTLSRLVRSQHPPKTSFPGVPAYAACTRTQRFRRDTTTAPGRSDSWDRFVIADLNRMSNIPFSDAFDVEMRYVFSRDGNNYCHVQVGLVVNFRKATWFKSQIHSSTRAESKDALEAWANEAMAFLETHKRRTEVAPPVPSRSASLVVNAPELGSETPSARCPVFQRETSTTRPSRDKTMAQAAPAVSISLQGDEQAWLRFPLRLSLLPRVLLLLLCLYALVLLRAHHVQMQQLTDATMQLLDYVQEQHRLVQHQAQAVRWQETCERSPSTGTMS